MLTQQQRLERNEAIYASDVYSLISGPSERAELILTKAQIIEPRSLDDVMAIQAGNRLENTVLQWASESLGTITTPTDTYRCYEFDRLRGHVDGLLFGQRAGVEVKVVGPGTASDYGCSGTDEVPDRVYAQCCAYMTILNYDCWYVAALINSTTLSIYKINRHELVCNAIVVAAINAWDEIHQCKQDPQKWLRDLDEDSTQGQSAIARIRNNGVNQRVLLDDSLISVFDERDRINGEIRSLSIEREALNAKIRKEMSGFKDGSLSDGSTITLKDVHVKERAAYDFTRMTIKRPKETKTNA